MSEIPLVIDCAAYRLLSKKKALSRQIPLDTPPALRPFSAMSQTSRAAWACTRQRPQSLKHSVVSFIVQHSIKCAVILAKLVRTRTSVGLTSETIAFLDHARDANIATAIPRPAASCQNVDGTLDGE